MSNRYRANVLHKFGFNIQGEGSGEISTRREVKQLCMFYKLNVGNSPEFLCDLISPSVGETNNYNLRNRHNVSHIVKLQIDYRYPNSHFFRRRPSHGIY